VVFNNAIMYIRLNEWRNGKKANLVLFAICYHPEIKWISFGFMCILCVCALCSCVCLYNWRDNRTKNVQCSIQTRSIHPLANTMPLTLLFTCLVSRDRHEILAGSVLIQEDAKTSLKWFHRKLCFSWGLFTWLALGII